MICILIQIIENRLWDSYCQSTTSCLHLLLINLMIFPKEFMSKTPELKLIFFFKLFFPLKIPCINRVINQFYTLHTMQMTYVIRAITISHQAHPVIWAARLSFLTGKTDHFGPFIYFIQFLPSLHYFRPFSMGTLSKMMGNFKILLYTSLCDFRVFDWLTASLKTPLNNGW